MSRRRNPTYSLPTRIQNLFYGIGCTPYLSPKLQKVYDDPTIYFVRKLLTESELTHLETLAVQYVNNFEKSFTENELNEEIISHYRTSEFINLSKAQDRIIRNIERKAAELVGMSTENVEPLQIVSYRNGQKFDTHHDAGTLMDDNHIELVQPIRLVTLFLYLNTLPQGQGHTEFPFLNNVLSIRPERGCGVLFCNILPNGQADPRTCHRACVVTDEYKKLGVNIWITDHSLQSLALIPSDTLLKKVEDKTTVKDTSPNFNDEEEEEKEKEGLTNSSKKRKSKS